MDVVTAAGMLDELMPMHLSVSKAGVILHAGPTLQKLQPHLKLKGAAFEDVFEIVRPRTLELGTDLFPAVGTKVHLGFKANGGVGVKGVIVAAPEGDAVVINLSFGIGVLEAVGDYGLTSADFAASDLTIEMLYLVEAKSAAMEASRQLNLRLQGAMIAAQEKAYTDGLTGLKNRRALDYLLEQMLGSKQPFTLMQLDLDFFKAVNDTLGHAAGDAVLCEVARVLNEETRDSDTVARVGGDEFIILLGGYLPDNRLEEIAGRFIQKIEVPVIFEGEECKISASIGMASTHIYDAAATASDLMADADAALYSSKRKGRACFTIFEKAQKSSAIQKAEKSSEEHVSLM
ncbi:MAG: diguanylate cyclase [Pseudomonadota bacterium]